MDKTKNISESVIFPRGEKAPEAVAKYFIGTNYLNMLVPFDSPLKCPIGNVTFDQGVVTTGTSIREDKLF